jgi:hypothetical protein
MRKESLLANICQLLGKKYLQVPNFVLPWRQLWEEALSLVTREDRKDSEISDSNVGRVHTAIVQLLHKCRSYIPKGDVDHIVETAMTKLANTAQPSCVEGLILLLNCLPTAYDSYDALLPRWLEIWDSMRFNAMWDACWLTLFCRARKHSDPTNPVWNKLSPLLQVKLHTFLSLPGASNSHASSGMFPFKFHAFYDALTPTEKAKAQPSQVAVIKATKIMYFLSLRPCPASELVLVDSISMTVPSCGDGNPAPQDILGYSAPAKVRPAAADIMNFVQSMRPFFYPSNTGPWTTGLAYMLAVFCAEISRHTGRNLANSVAGEKAGARNEHAGYVIKGHGVFEQPAHLETIRFLMGTMTALAMEGVYGKSGAMQQLCNASLRNLVAVDPTLGRVIVPFLLQSLDPSAVAQSHQAPAAMGTLTNLMKPLLFPCPVMLGFLPQLLELSLPGVDPNDPKKSLVTLKMYCSLLAALPIRRSYAVPQEGSYPPAYLTMLTSEDPNQVGQGSAYEALYSSYIASGTTEALLSNLAASFESWAPQLLERIFGLLNATEEPKKGSPQSGVNPLIEMCIHNLFMTIVEPESVLRTTLEDMLLAYLRDSNNINAAKVCAKVAGQLNYNPGFVKKLVDTLATHEVLSLQCSNDRLVFRIHVLAGAAREAGGECMQFMDTWKTLTTPKFVYHNDKPIRKAACKLLKEIMRGTTSFNPKMKASYQGSLGNPVIGSPTNRTRLLEADHQVFEWYEPSSEALAGMVPLIKATTYSAMEEIRADLALVGKEGQDIKKLEERITRRIKLVGKVLRGTAEVLCDDMPREVIACVQDDDVMEQTPGGEDDGGATADIMVNQPNEGIRQRALEKLSKEDAKLYKTFRGEVLRLLLEIRSALRPPAASASMDVVDADNNQLSSSVMMHKAWAKVFTFVICRRSSNNKSMEMAKRWQNMNLSMSRTVLSKSVRRALKLRGLEGDADPLNMAGKLSNDRWKTLLARRTYWDGHGVSPDDHVQRVVIQHYARLGQWSYESTRRALKVDLTASLGARRPLLACLNFLTDVCSHEYDAVRESGNKAFAAVITRYGTYANSLVRRMLTTVLAPEAPDAINAVTYAQTSGALRLLQSPYMMMRILRDWDLSSLLFDTLCSMPPRITALNTDEAKKELLTSNVAGTFVKYISKLSHMPVDTDRTDAAAMLTDSLKRVGYSSSSNGVNMAVDASSENGGNTYGGGIRFDAFNSYMVTALIGHPNIEISAAVWSWTLRTLASAHGQPAQMIAWGALCRLCMLRAKGSSVISAECDAAVKPLLTCKGGDTGMWPSLLLGISSAHPKGGEDGDSAQWSGGVESVLKSLNSLVTVSPHRQYSLAFESNILSSYYVRECSVMFVNMFQVGLLDVTDFETVSALLEVAKSKLGEGASEAETRRNNATHAELFAALLSAVVASKDPASATKVADLLLSHYITALDKLSLEFTKDWDEAFLFALSGPPSAIVTPFLKHVVSSFKQTFSGNGNADPVVSSLKVTGDGAAVNEASDEGFNAQGKRMVTTAVVLRALVTSSWQETPETAHITGERRALLKDMAEAIVAAGNGTISAYRTSRIYMSGILRSLLVRGAHGGDFAPELLEGLYTTLVEHADRASESRPAPEDNKDTKGEEDNDKNALETVCAMLDSISADFPVIAGNNKTSAAQKAACEKCVVALARCAVKGCGHPDPETTSRSHHSITQYVACIHRGISNGSDAAPADVLSEILKMLGKQATHTSFRVRLAVVECVMTLMADNWPSLTTPEKTAIKDIFIAGFSDSIPEVQKVSQAGFSGYLGFKTPSEVKKFSEAFCRNSDKYVAIEKQKKKAGEAIAVDAKFVNMVNMMCCIVLAFPYDMPPFIPQLLSCVVRHSGASAALKATISRTVLEFKRTHQDRWSEFKVMFTNDQLDSLTGASQVSYFS